VQWVCVKLLGSRKDTVRALPWEGKHRTSESPIERAVVFSWSHMAKGVRAGKFFCVLWGQLVSNTASMVRGELPIDFSKHLMDQQARGHVLGRGQV